MNVVWSVFFVEKGVFGAVDLKADREDATLLGANKRRDVAENGATGVTAAEVIPADREAREVLDLDGVQTSLASRISFPDALVSAFTASSSSVHFAILLFKEGVFVFFDEAWEGVAIGTIDAASPSSTMSISKACAAGVFGVATFIGVLEAVCFGVGVFLLEETALAAGVTVAWGVEVTVIVFIGVVIEATEAGIFGVATTGVIVAVPLGVAS